MRKHVVGILTTLTTDFENCMFGIAGAMAIEDTQGNYTFTMTALDNDTGMFSSPAAFRSNYYHPMRADRELLLRLIPAVEFQQCRQKES